MKSPMPIHLAGLSLGLIACLGLAACGGGADQPTQQRGAPAVAGAQPGAAPAPAGGGGKAAGPDAAGGEDPQPEERKRPKIVLTREDFGPRTRDPFERLLGADATDIVEAPVVVAQRQRDVKLSEYAFEDLKLIAIVMSGRGVQPRALFKATDGKSKTVRQGEYFSRAEVLLAAVNREYVEIEVVDEELAKGLNLGQGERRAIYLKND